MSRWHKDIRIFIPLGLQVLKCWSCHSFPHWNPEHCYHMSPSTTVMCQLPCHLLNMSSCHVSLPCHHCFSLPWCVTYHVSLPHDPSVIIILGWNWLMWPLQFHPKRPIYQQILVIRLELIFLAHLAPNCLLGWILAIDHHKSWLLVLWFPSKWLTLL